MNANEALTIFKNIESPDYEDGQRGMAIKTVMEMPTYDSVSDSAMMKVFKWLLTVELSKPAMAKVIRLLLPLYFDVHDDGGNKDAEGVCPVCGEGICYTGEHEFDDSGGKYGWECPHCGASGEEGYNRALDRHYNVVDKNGNPVPGKPE